MVKLVTAWRARDVCLAVTLVCSLGLAGIAAAAPEPASIRAASVVTEIAPGAFVRVGATADATAENADGIANIGFIIGSRAVAVIDPGGSLLDGQRLRAAIRTKTALPIRYVIMTHDHPDHVFGAEAFLQDHPIFVGSWRLPAGLADRAAYDQTRLASILGEAATGRPVPPTLLVQTTQPLDLGGRTLVLQAQAIAHSGDDLTILDTATKTLWAGDLLFVGRVPSLDGSLLGWLHVLDKLQAVGAGRAVPGHGPASVPWPQAASDERRYLTILLRDVRSAVKAGTDIDTAVATAAQSERGRWALFDAYNGRNVTEAYKELQWE